MQTILEQLQVMANNPANEGVIIELWNHYYGSATRRIRPNDEETVNSDMRFFTPYRLMQMMQNGAWNPDDRWYIETSDWNDQNNAVRSFNDPREVIDLQGLSEKIIRQKTVVDRARNKIKSLKLPPHLSIFQFA